MKNLKNQKRTMNVAIAFLLTFLVGAAFAFAAGALEIEGNLNLTMLESGIVRWVYVSYDSVDDEDGGLESVYVGTLPGGITLSQLGETHSVEVSNVEITTNDDGTRDQVITLDLHFRQDPYEMLGGAAIARFTAVATNHSNDYDANVSAPVPVFSFVGGYSEAEMGFGITTLEDNLTGTLLTGASGYVSFEISWTPTTLPSSFGTTLVEYFEEWDDYALEVDEGVYIGGYVLVPNPDYDPDRDPIGTITITLPYTPIV